MKNIQYTTEWGMKIPNPSPLNFTHQRNAVIFAWYNLTEEESFGDVKDYQDGYFAKYIMPDGEDIYLMQLKNNDVFEISKEFYLTNKNYWHHNEDTDNKKINIDGISFDSTHLNDTFFPHCVISHHDISLIFTPSEIHNLKEILNHEVE